MTNTKDLNQPYTKVILTQCAILTTKAYITQAYEYLERKR